MLVPGCTVPKSKAAKKIKNRMQQLGDMFGRRDKEKLGDGEAVFKAAKVGSEPQEMIMVCHPGIFLPSICHFLQEHRDQQIRGSTTHTHAFIQTFRG